MWRHGDVTMHRPVSVPMFPGLRVKPAIIGCMFRGHQHCALTRDSSLVRLSS